jgi:hypothetical protein
VANARGLDYIQDVMDSPLPTTDDLRREILHRALTYCQLTGKSRSALGLDIANDFGLLWRLERGDNITFTTYDRVRRWLDRHWPQA